MYKQAIDAGGIDTTINLVLLYLTTTLGQRKLENKRETVEQLLSEARRVCPGQALNIWGDIYNAGELGLQRDLAKAKSCYQLAIDYGVELAQQALIIHELDHNNSNSPQYYDQIQSVAKSKGCHKSLYI